MARYDKCLNVSSDYMEVWCVSSATMYTPNSEHILGIKVFVIQIFTFLCSFVLVLWHAVPNLPQMDVWNVNKFDFVLT